MIKKVFVDSDVILDVALARKPFLKNSKMLLNLAQNDIIHGFTSSICTANIHYFLRKELGEKEARLFLSGLISFISILGVDHTITLNALKSDFGDFEDALQYGAALQNGCSYIISRNTEDYKNSKIQVYTPDEFLRLYTS
ncbi:PIN domain-containing protein [Spirochaetia bacterium]|nr:PIN domain-containing protein [Spirochaetia bacterium]